VTFSGSLENNLVNIVAADPDARVLSEAEVLTLLEEPIIMHLGMVDATGWPLVHPVWHVFGNGVFRLVVAKTSRKANLLRATRRAYFTVDTGTAAGNARGVRGRADVRIIDGDVDLAVDVARQALLKYTGTDRDSHAEDMLKWARGGEGAVIELAPSQFRAFGY
jgi:hypothetical protein